MLGTQNSHAHARVGALTHLDNNKHHSVNNSKQNSQKSRGYYTRQKAITTEVGRTHVNMVRNVYHDEKVKKFCLTNKLQTAVIAYKINK